MRRVLCLVLASACGENAPPVDTSCEFRSPKDDMTTPALDTPRWAFRPWVAKDISNGDDTRQLIAGFREHDIPVGVVLLDSPWATHYNTFVVNEQRYGNFPQLLADLHADDIRVVMWTTQMVNRTAFDLEENGDTYIGEAPHYAEGQRCGFFVDNGADYLWWKGFGAAVDFFNPEAVAWWHRQQDALIELGVDGWKLDFGDAYIADSVETHVGTVERQQYSEAYYQDMWTYGAHLRGTENFVTMVRPYDRSYGFTGRFYARPEHAPVAWVGDNRRDWLGMIDALDHLFRSAAAGYVVIGSDIGGYLDKDDEGLGGPTIPFDTLVFARWTALGALNPFMQLMGRANKMPWTVPDHVEGTIALYRYWASFHDELVPWWHSMARTAQRGGAPLMKPIGTEAQWTNDYRFTLGDALLVAPILDATDARDIALPQGRWFDWWTNAPLDGNTTLVGYSVPRERFPVFVREGAIMPATVASNVTGFGTAARANALTVLAWPGAATTSFELVDEDNAPTTITASTTTLTLTRAVRPTYFRVHRPTAPTSVSAGAAVADAAALDAATNGWFHDPSGGWLWIKVPASTGTVTITIQ